MTDPLKDAMHALFQSDPVHHPSHYLGPGCPTCGTPMETKYLIQDMPYFRGAAVKYLVRAGKKDGAPEIQDLEKAIECIQIEIERLKEDRWRGS